MTIWVDAQLPPGIAAWIAETFGVSAFPDERELLGNLTGLSLAHLLCNDGEGTLSCANLGATVTGVDISDAAITIARRLADESGIAATFHRMMALRCLPTAKERVYPRTRIERSIVKN